MDFSRTRDVWFEILLKFQANDVAELRRVSKFYRDLIDSPDFIQRHYKLSTELYVVVPSSRCYQLVDLGKSPMAHNLTSFLKDDFSSLTLVGCCMGILCYEVQYLDCLVFWNPCTGSFRKTSLHRNKLSHKYKYFLGHDAVNDDVKVLKMRKMLTPFVSYGDCEMYSSKTDFWTKISSKGYLLTYDHHSPYVFLEGTDSVHWISKTSTKVIMAYNFSTQKFNQLPMPKISKPSYKLSSLSPGGCLSLCIYLDSPCLEVWTMKEYGVEESWTRLRSITYPRYIFSWWVYPMPLVLLNNGSHVVILFPEKGLYLYHVLESNWEKKLNFDFGEDTAFPYTPTLRKP